MTVALDKRSVKQKSKPLADAMLTVSAAARTLGISRTQVRRYCDSGYLAYGLYPGGRRMISRNAVEAFRQRAMEGRL